MRSYFTVRRTPKGDVFQFRLYMTDEDAQKYRYDIRPKLCTENGAHWTRHGFNGQVNPKSLNGYWVYDCKRTNNYGIRFYFDLKPGERRYYPVRITYDGAEVQVSKPTTKEKLETEGTSPERG